MAEKPAAAAVSLSVQPEKGEAFEFGKLAGARFVLKNVSDKAVVVLAVKPVTNRAEEAVVLYGNVYGSVKHAPLENLYHLDGMQQRATHMRFYSGLLLPGQEVSVHARYRPLFEKERFAIEYVASESAYGDAAESLKPLNPYIPKPAEGGQGMPGMRATYCAFEDKAWRDICKAVPHAGEVGPGAPDRAVLLPDLSVASQSQFVDVAVTITGAEFPGDKALTAAAGIAGTPAEDVTIAYAQALGGYVVLEKECSWILKSAGQAERGERLPALPASLLRDVDLSGKVRVRVGEKQEGFGPEKHDAGRKLWDAYAVVYGDGMYTRGEFVEITGKELLEFLSKVAEKGGKLTEKRYFSRSRYFELQLTGQ